MQWLQNPVRIKKKRDNVQGVSHIQKVKTARQVG